MLPPSSSGILLQHDMVSRCRRLQLESSLPWKCKISQLAKWLLYLQSCWGYSNREYV